MKLTTKQKKQLRTYVTQLLKDAEEIDYDLDLLKTDDDIFNYLYDIKNTIAYIEGVINV